MGWELGGRPAQSAQPSAWAGAPIPAGPQWPSVPPSRSQARAWIALAVGVLFVSFVAGVAFLGFGHDWEATPKAWDPQVAPVAAQVAALRGLSFKHPVQVNYLSPRDFEKRVTASPAELRQQHKELEQMAALLRAAGVLGPNVDLGEAVNTSQGADVVAFYDEDDKQVYIRGTGPITVETRVILAHELTHVLQDQYFDIRKLRKAAARSKTGSNDALTALIEGDAERIKAKYLAELPASERKAYDRLSNSTADRADEQSKGVPAVIELAGEAPYIFGPPITTILDLAGGTGAVDAALTEPAPSTNIFFDPSAVNQPLDPPSVPGLQAGEKRLAVTKDDTQFDAFLLYLMLATRVDRPTALRAIDGFAAGSSAVYTTGGSVCFRAAVVGRTPSATRNLATLLARWAKAMPSARIESTGGPVVFHSCDGGRRTPAPRDATITQAVRLAAARDELAVAFVGDTAPSRSAVCAVRVLFQQKDVQNDVLGGGSLANPSAQMLAEARAAATKCRDDADAGRP